MIQQKGADRSRRSPDRGLPATIHLMPAEGGKAERCNQCGQELIEIDNRGERLVGCLTCNLWAAPNSTRWTRLGEEDLRALHHLRHGGSR